MQNRKLEDVNVLCGSCIHYHVSHDTGPDTCRRHTARVRRYIYKKLNSQCHSLSRKICREYRPDPDRHPWLASVWTSFDDYHNEDTDRTVTLIIDNDWNQTVTVDRRSFEDGDDDYQALLANYS